MNLLHRAPLSSAIRARSVTAILGPTNTGKTHFAIERLLGHESGAIGLPLRLLAREVYGRVAARAGVNKVALVTGEEKIIPSGAKYWVSTVEAMPRDLQVAFVAIDEVQLAGDLERGHIFTDRLLNMRGTAETLLLGSSIARPLIERLLPGVIVTARPRLSQLLYAGSKKITRLPRRSAIVAFSAEEVYAVAELIRRQRGGAAVVMGALSPRTRNAQVELFQNGDVDFLVATDAIGMGLNLDVGHVAFAQERKFDGFQFRRLNAAELGQIAGRAGRYLNDGTFGVTGRVDDFEDELVQAIESHDFDSITSFQWRNANLDFSSPAHLRHSLELVPNTEGLTRALPADDQRALDYALRDPAIEDAARGKLEVELLWDVAQVPDFRKISPAHHGDLVVQLYRFLMRRGKVPDDWFARQVAFCERLDGDIDSLSQRLADIRTWTFVANRQRWLADPVHWQERTRAIEDRLSDVLHEKLTQRFVDRRTSVLMKRLREKTMLEAEISTNGAVLVEGQPIGELHGFRFVPDQTVSADGPDGKAIRAAAVSALAGEFDKRAEKLSKAANEEFVLSSDGTMRWQGQPVGKLAASEDALSPTIILLADDQLAGAARDKVQGRLDLWLGAHIQTLLKPLQDLKSAPDLEGLARGIAFRMVEALGTLERSAVADDVKALDQTQRAVLRKYGVRFGAYHIYVPTLLKPAPATLVAQLWALKHASLDVPGLAELPQMSASGRTSIKVDPAFDKTLYRLVGFRVAGERAVRLDILERLADIIRPLIAWKATEANQTPPDGAIAQGGAFTVTVAMTSLLGCSGEDFASILKGLGYRLERKTIKVPVKAEAATPSEAPVAEVAATAEAAPEASEQAAVESPVADAAPAETVAVEAASAEETGVEAAPVDAEAIVEAAPAAILEDKEIEIWRPGRGDRPRRPEHRPQGGQPREPRPEGERPARPQGERQPWRGDRPQRDARPDQRQDQRNENREGQRPRPDGDQQKKPYAGNRPDRNPRDDRAPRDDRRPREEERPQRREKPIDPTSPFAALAALKANLEQKQKK